MSIDADLNAGLIDQKEAKARRKDIASEADFYGSMDGASKFVRGDAIAGLLILFIQHKYKIISLDSKIYYVENVPVFIEFYHIISLNIIVLFFFA